MNSALLRIDGAVAEPLSLTFDDLRTFTDGDQVPDVSKLDARYKGGGVTLAGVLRRAVPAASADFLTLHSTADGFCAELPLATAREVGILVYQLGGEPLQPAQGGPIRFVVPNAADCRMAEVDMCKNVKFIDWIEITCKDT